MIKIFLASLQHYVNLELPDVHLGFRKGRGTRDQIGSIWWNIEKSKEFQKTICFINLTELCGSQQIGKFLRWEYQTNLICLLRKLYADQTETIRSRQGTINWFKIGKRVQQGCILSPCVFNLYAEYILKNAGLEEAQAGIKIAGRNINNLRYAETPPRR